ncbi:Imm32 family immunity protein [Streptomyces hoynatensis]|uniref:Imm32 family immunity protein n=1 Tax=Streptomyces hoynatensis TaxID=1141874 RepID=UPI0019D4531A|nr:hypothetical protein [Streptomyces hoynatensis]
MRIVRDRVYGEVDLSASAAELNRLAGAVAGGEGLLRSTAGPGGEHLAGVEVTKGAGPGVRIRLDASRGILVISGDEAARAVLADNLRAMAAAGDGGHLHLDHFPGHPYLAEGSVPLVVNSPHGGMPAR